MPEIAGAISPMNDVEITSDAPLTEALHTKMGANLNALIGGYLPIGSTIHSLLTEAQFQSEIGSTGWVLAQGQSIAGSALETLTGISTLPDCRGRFLRGKNNGAAAADGDADGERTLGAFQGSKLATHTHAATFTDIQFQNAYAKQESPSVGLKVVLSYPGFNGVGFTLLPPPSTGQFVTPVTVDVPIPGSGTTTNGNETAPKNICMNIFVRIN